MAEACELNVDGLVGPTHNYMGLSYGNVASMRHSREISNPREAALKGLLKMKILMDLGVNQALLPPHERPHLPTLRRLGFCGTDEEVVVRAAKEAPELLAAASSASAMWTANSAVVSPSADALDGKVHFTPANLITHLHRSIETDFTAGLLKRVFPGPEFSHHDPLPAADAMSDEGAANHVRLSPEHGARGVEIFVYGRRAWNRRSRGPERFPARQTREACEAIARLHRLDPRSVLFLAQNPELIDQGVFHNDVIGTANERVFFCHRRAFAGGMEALRAVQDLFKSCCGQNLVLIEISDQELTPGEAVETYLFNSQIATLPGGDMAFIAPLECREHQKTRDLIHRLLSDQGNPIRSAHYADLRQSMKNGGGPACLRFRAVLTPREMASVHEGALLSPARRRALEDWIRRAYRDRLAPEDLGDKEFLRETRTALDELTRILGLGPIYDFQR